MSIFQRTAFPWGKIVALALDIVKGVWQNPNCQGIGKYYNFDSLQPLQHHVQEEMEIFCRQLTRTSKSPSFSEDPGPRECNHAKQTRFENCSIKWYFLLQRGNWNFRPRNDSDGQKSVIYDGPRVQGVKGSQSFRSWKIEFRNDGSDSEYELTRADGCGWASSEPSLNFATGFWPELSAAAPTSAM